MDYYDEDGEYDGSMFGGNRKCREGYKSYTTQRCLPARCISKKYGNTTRSSDGKCPTGNPDNWTLQQIKDNPSGHKRVEQVYMNRNKNWFNNLSEEKKDAVRRKRAAAKKSHWNLLSDAQKQQLKQRRNMARKSRYVKKPRKTKTKTVKSKKSVMSKKDLDSFFDNLNVNTMGMN